MTTYSLEEAARIICGSDVPASVQWLAKRLRSGELPGYKSARRWRMTAEDVEAALEQLHPKRVLPDVPNLAGMTRTSRRRLVS